MGERERKVEFETNWVFTEDLMLGIDYPYTLRLKLRVWRRSPVQFSQKIMRIHRVLYVKDNFLTFTLSSVPPSFPPFVESRCGGVLLFGIVSISWEFLWLMWGSSLLFGFFLCGHAWFCDDGSVIQVSSSSSFCTSVDVALVMMTCWVPSIPSYSFL